MSENPEAVLDFWLDEVGVAGWYAQDDALDVTIRQRFEPLWRKARGNRLTDWAQAPRGALALLIVLDQFPRNIFRGEGLAFSTDKRALKIAKQAVAEGHDLHIANPQRQFFYLPYMHSEDLTDQHACVALIAERGPRNTLFHAHAHRAVIERFGRFPYRNAALKRETTSDERAYIEAGLYAPDGWRAPSDRTAIQVYMTLSDAKGAIDWYTRAFGAVESARMDAQDGQRLLYARLEVFGGAIMLADAFPEMAPGIVAPDLAGSTGVTITVNVETSEAVDATIEAAAKAGAAVTMPAADMAWGARYGQVTDPFGHRWAFAGPEGGA